MKGIILAGGLGTRLYPLTKSISKQILPVYDKPMIYYPLSMLMFAGIKEVLIISTKRDLLFYQDLFKDGAQLGMSFSYIVQENPNGLAESFILGEQFIGKDSVCLVLGDNIFYGHDMPKILQNASVVEDGGIIFAYYVNNPEDYGVVTFDEQGKATSIIEKPQNPQSRYAVPGIYFYDNNVVEIAKNIQPSSRGELEITTVNQVYLNKGKLQVEIMGRGTFWMDTGNPDGLLEAGNFVSTIQNRQGLYVSCIEEIAYRQGFINKSALIQLTKPLAHTQYGQYLLDLIEQ